MSRTIAGIYEIGEEIGSGGGGVVYRGRHLRLNKPVALKADKRTLDIGMERLQNEVKVLKNLSHTYIPHVYDFVQEDGMVYTVMDFIEGVSLDKLLVDDEGRERRLPQRQVLRWGCQLLEALDYLHTRSPKGILHGDIKPANIMLRPSGNQTGQDGRFEKGSGGMSGSDCSGWNTLDGDICLIDFNIALALEEDGAVKMGWSDGYASPEHYGYDYTGREPLYAEKQTLSHRTRTHGRKKRTSESRPEKVRRMTRLVDRSEEERRTQQVNDGGKDRRTRKLNGSGEAGGRDSSSQGNIDTGKGRIIMLDVRSDIYSLGATLYHLLSGHCPEEDAWKVTALGSDICSRSVSEIIRKAMEPNPDRRYQSAREMHTAFLELYQTDIRSVRYRRHVRAAAAALTVLFLSGGACALTGLKQMEQLQAALARAGYSADALAKGDVPEAVRLAVLALPRGNSIFNAPVTPQAQKALTDALGVYDLSDGFKDMDVLGLPSAPFGLEVSADGSKLAVIYAGEMAIYDFETRQPRAVLQTQDSALSDAEWIDENRIVYAGAEGVTVYDINKGASLWNGEPATELAVSGDGTKVAAVDRDEDHAVIYRISDGKKITECSFDGKRMPVAENDSFADPENTVFAMNQDGTMLAVSFAGGGLTVFGIDRHEDDMVLYESSDYTCFEGGFYENYFGFTAGGKDGSLFGLVDVEKGEYIGDSESPSRLSLQADAGGIFISKDGRIVKFDPETLTETEKAYLGSLGVTAFLVKEKYTLAAADDNSFTFFDQDGRKLSTGHCKDACNYIALTDRYAVLGNRNEPELRLLKLEDREDAQLLAYDAGYAHDEARVSQDKRTVMLFQYKGFRIYDMEGQVLEEKSLPDAEKIYDQQFRKTAGGSWLEVTWYDGKVRCYSALDGALLSEEMKEPPSRDLYEEFYTDKYRIISPLHGVPEVYDLKTGKLAATLEQDAYLTYVTQAGEYIVTQYVTADGYCYGQLLNGKCEVLAELPYLCDVVGERLIFDYPTGDLRETRIYKLEELREMAKTGV